MVKKCQRLKKFRKFVGTILPTQIYENPRVYPCYSLSPPSGINSPGSSRAKMLSQPCTLGVGPRMVITMNSDTLCEVSEAGDIISVFPQNLWLDRVCYYNPSSINFCFNLSNAPTHNPSVTQ